MDQIQSHGMQGRVADAPSGHWVYNALPRSFWPYAQIARWDRPIGSWLLLWPCWWSAALAPLARSDMSLPAWAYLANPFHLALFFIGAIAMRGAGCTYNDLVDKDIDGSVARTASRPLPSGQITTNRAKLFLIAQALIGFLVLIQFNLNAIWIGLGSLAVVAVYPFMKRYTDWPQFFLGLAFSWGAFMGWAALFGSLSLAPLLLYVGCICWTIGYDTIYAHQDREDDALIGVRSTARLFGDKSKLAVGLFYGAMLACFSGAYLLVGVNIIGWVGLAAAAAHFGYQIVKLDIDDADQCLALFQSNSTVGWLIFIGLCGAGLMTAVT